MYGQLIVHIKNIGLFTWGGLDGNFSMKPSANESEGNNLMDCNPTNEKTQIEKIPKD